jgi:hypothetical protein
MLQAPKHRSWRYPAHEKWQVLILRKIKTLLGALVFMHADHVPDTSHMKELMRTMLQPLDEIDFWLPFFPQLL